MIWQPEEISTERYLCINRVIIYSLLNYVLHFNFNFNQKFRNTKRDLKIISVFPNPKLIGLRVQWNKCKSLERKKKQFNLKKTAWTFQVWFKAVSMQGKTARIWRAFGGERDNSRQKSRFRERKVARKPGMLPQTTLLKCMRSSWQFPLICGRFCLASMLPWIELEKFRLSFSS